jgi:hypothetical protein
MDPLESCLGGCAQPVARLFLFLSAVWVGCVAAAMPIAVGWSIGGPLEAWARIPFEMLVAPKLMLTRYFFLNGAALAVVMFLFFQYEVNVPKWWFGIAISQSLFAMFGWIQDFDDFLIQLLVWFCWLVTVAVLIGGGLFVRQWLMSRHGRQLWMLRAENRLKRAELEKRGIATFDPEE